MSIFVIRMEAKRETTGELASKHQYGVAEAGTAFERGAAKIEIGRRGQSSLAAFSAMLCSKALAIQCISTATSPIPVRR